MAGWLEGLTKPFISSTNPSQCLSKKSKMAFGPCQVKDLRGKPLCPCETGIYVSSTSAVDSQAFCLNCHHLLAGHLDYEKDLTPGKVHEEETLPSLVSMSEPEGMVKPPTTVPLNRGTTLNLVHSNERPPGSSLITNAERQSPEAAKEKGRVQPTSTLHLPPPDLCPRLQTVTTLTHMLEEHAIVHVRGTPASGKTSLAMLLQAHLERCRNVILISGWTLGHRPEDILVYECQMSGYEVSGTDLLRSKSGDFVFIIDEAQLSYTDSKLWYSVIKSRLGSSYGPWFCLFASYGSPSHGSPSYPTSVTPPILSLGQRVSLVSSTKPGSPGICLFFSMDEFEDAVARYCQENVEVTLAKDLQGYIFAITNGHPGMIRSLLVYMKTIFRNRLKRTDIREIGFNDIRDDLEDNDKLFGFLKRAIAGRSLPSREMMNDNLDPKIIDVLLRILRNGYVEFDSNDSAMVRCFRMGFIHTEAVSGQRMACILPSSIHARFIEYYYARPPPGPFPYHLYPDIGTLCLSVLRSFSRESLCSAGYSRRFGPSGKLRPPEASFQDEYYRSFWAATRSRIGISSEWTYSGDGRIDFQILGPDWGVEMLRDGDRIRDHCNRFQPTGAYYPWIQQGKLKDWLVLDCRHSYPRTTYPSESKLWRVVFLDDYSRVHILDCNNKEVVPEFGLANR